MSLINGRVRLGTLNGFRLGVTYDPTPEPAVKPEEAIGLIGGVGLLAGSSVVEGEGKLLLALLGLGVTFFSGYSVISRMMAKSQIPAPGTPVVQVAPGTPGAFYDQATGQYFVPTSAIAAAAPAGSLPATSGAGMPFRAPQPEPQKISTPQAISAFANPFAKIVSSIFASTPSPVITSYGSSPYPSSPVPGIVTYGDLFKSSTPAAPVPGMVTSYDYGGSDYGSWGTNEESGFVTSLDGRRSMAGWHRRTMEGVANGA